MKKIFCLSFVLIIVLCGCTKSISPDIFAKQTKDSVSAMNNAASGKISGTIKKIQNKTEKKSSTDTYFIKENGVYTYTQSFTSDTGYSSIYTNGKDSWNFNGISTEKNAVLSKTPVFLTTLSSIIPKSNIQTVTVKKKSKNKIYTVTPTDEYLKKTFTDKKYTVCEYKYTLNSKGELISYTLRAGNKDETTETTLNIDTGISKEDAVKKINDEISHYR